MDKTEKRQSTRRPIEYTVFVATGLGPPLKCKMLDISELGARLRVAHPRSAPQEFLITFGAGLARWCRVMWRSDTEIGIKFVDPPQSLKASEKPTGEKAEEESGEKTEEE